MILERPWLGHLQGRYDVVVRFAIVVSVLAISFAVGNSGSSTRVLMMLAGLGAAVAVLLFLRWPIIALLAIPVANLLVPFSLPTGTQTRVPPALVVIPAALCLWLLMQMVSRRTRLHLPRPSIALIVLSGTAIVAFGAGFLPGFPFASPAPLAAQLGGTAVLVISAIAFVLASNLIDERVHLKALVWISLSLMTLPLLIRIAPPLGRVFGAFISRGATGSVMWLWLVAVAASQALLNRKLRNPLRGLLLLVVGGVFYVNMFQGRAWSSGWIPPLVALAVILLMTFPRLGWPAAIAGSALAVLNWQRVWSGLLVGDNTYSLMTRLEAWEIIFEIAKGSPIIGLGPANYYFYTSLYPILGWYVNFSSHNNYVDLFAQTGMLGLLAFLWFAWEMGRALWKMRLSFPDGSFEKAFIVGAIGGLVGMLVAGMLGDWFLPFVYNIGIEGMRASLLGWLMLGGAMALKYVPNPRVSTGERPATITP